MTRDIIAKSGEYTLTRIDGMLTVEERGKAILDENDYDDFHDFVGIYFGAGVEIAVLEEKAARKRCASEDPSEFDSTTTK